MKSKYDAIIIGSGLGGLSAAAALAKRGLSVLVLEKHTQPGGYATTFSRGRFEFEVSLHALTGIGTPLNPGPLFHDLEALDVARRVEFIPMDDLYRSVGPTWDFVLPTGISAYQQTLIDLFPEEARGIERLIRQVLTIGYEVDRLRVGRYSTAPLPTLWRFPNLVHAAGVPLSHLLDRELSSPLAKSAVAQIWSYFALPPSKLSLLMFAVGLNMHLLYGSATIKGKSQSLSNAFADVIRESGGTVAFSRTVTQILIENGGVVGVETAEKERFFSDTVVSNMDPVTTLTRLSDPSVIPSGFRSRLQQMPPGLSTVNVYLGLSKPSSALDIRDYEVCINREMDLEAQYQSGLTLGAPGTITLCAYDLKNPVAAPKGAGMVTITAMSEGRFWETMHPDKYIDAKHQMTHWMLSQAARVFPKLIGAVETTSISTPITNMSYTGNPGGAVYGFANTPLQNPGFRLENQSPIPGLYWAGAWTRPGGGYQAVIASGMNAASMIVAKKVAEGTAVKSEAKSGRMVQEKPPNVASRKFRGLGLILKDGKQVQSTLRTKYKKHKNETIEPTTVSVTDVVRRFRAEQLQVVLEERKRETHNTVTLRFKALSGELPPFVSGQYFSVHMMRDGIRTSRAYSVSSPASERSYIEFTVKHRIDGDISRRLAQDLAVGDMVELTGPFGDFSFNIHRDAPHVVGIAAGSGITPFMSMLEDKDSGHHPAEMTLFYGSRSESDIIFFDRLMKASKQRTRLTIIWVLSQPSADWKGETGRIDAALIRRHLMPESLRQSSFFLCAQRSLNRSLTKELITMGVEESNIRLEAFGPPSDVTKEDDWPLSVESRSTFLVHYPGREKPIHASAGVPLLVSLERAGVRLPAHCRSGVCDACKMELVSGEVFIPENVLGTHPVAPYKRIPSCMSYPLSDVSLQD
jgi:prolycopene isomerase